MSAAFELPEIITTDEIAEALKWSTQRTRRWLIKSGAGVKIGDRWVTTPALLREHFRPAWDAYASRVLLGQE